MDLFIAQVPDALSANTVDTPEVRSKDQNRHGYLWRTMFATHHGHLKRQLSQWHNFIYRHTSPLYNHLDETEWLENDPFTQYKEDLISEDGIAVCEKSTIMCIHFQ